MDSDENHGKTQFITMPDFLRLPHFRTLNAHDEGDYYRVEAEGNVIPTACPACTNSLYRHGSQRQSYMDTPMHGKRVLLEIDRKRFRCKSCGKTLFEPLPDIDSKRMATSRLIRYIEERCLKITFLSLAREIGVDDKTIRFIFDDLIKRLETEIHFETPEILGIDEIKIVGEYRAILTNISKLSVFYLRSSRKKVDLSDYFAKMPDKQNVKIIVMDMWHPYQQMAKEQFPGRPIVVDKFHVVSMANNALERVRKRVRKALDAKTRIKLKNERFVLLKRRNNLTDKELIKLKEWSELFPELGIAYKLKEQFFQIYDAPDRGSAEQLVDQWDISIPTEVERDFKELRTALRNWRIEIFNYFEYPVTNAYTESVNNLARSINRMGRGYSFEVIRARLLYDETARKDTCTSIRKKKRKEVPVIGFVTSRKQAANLPKQYETIGEEKFVEYGPYIPTLVRLLEDGYFS